jgi:hypothetical protein
MPVLRSQNTVKASRLTSIACVPELYKPDPSVM